MADVSRAGGEEMTPVTLREAALAEQVRVMRELAKEIHEKADEWHSSVEWEGREYTGAALESCDAMLALTPTEAEAQAKANAEVAAQVPGLAEQVRVMREAIESALEGKSVRHIEDSTDLKVCYDWCPRCKLEAALDLRDAIARVAELEAQLKQAPQTAGETAERG